MRGGDDERNRAKVALVSDSPGSSVTRTLLAASRPAGARHFTGPALAARERRTKHGEILLTPRAPYLGA